ncbi:MAG: type II toxin-antitoxin system HicB family antitoxin [Armatimonadetes bacterium]|nr:type II toxin-antitoxin system HicB family antitoxin [Armatimonadota bacterium]
MTLKVLVHKAEEGGYWAEVPALPGCFTKGETREEIEFNVREAIEAYLGLDETVEGGEDTEILEIAV